MISFSTGMKQTFEKPAKEYVDEKHKLPVDLNVRKRQVTYSTKIETLGNNHHFRYQGDFMSELEIYSFLLSENDKDINVQIKKSKKCHGLQFIGFVAIPLGITGLITMATGSEQNDNTIIALGGLCSLTAIACPISSGIFKRNRGKANKEAVRIYNQKY